MKINKLLLYIYTDVLFSDLLREKKMKVASNAFHISL